MATSARKPSTTRKPRRTAATAASTDAKLIYAFREGNASMRSTLGGKGAGLAEMTNAGLPVPPGFTITTEACNAYYAAGKELPDGPVGRRRGAHARAGARDRQGIRRSGQPSARQRPIRRRIQHARDDGHRPQPRAQPRHRAGAHRAHRQRALRVGCLAAVRGDVRPDRARPEGGGLRRAVRRAEGAGGSEARHGPDRGAAARHRQPVHRDRQREDRRAIPDRSVPAAGARRSRRLRLLVRQAGARLPRVQQDPARPRDRGQRGDDGLRQHGRRFRHRRRLHARPEHREQRSSSAST